MLRKIGVEIRYLEDGKTTATMDNAMDSFVIGLQTLLDRNFSESNSKRICTGMLEGAKKGNLNFAQILGYNKVGDHLEINEKEAEIVRTIFRMYTEEGKGFRRIAQELNELGYRSKNGKKFSHNSVGDIISNSKYYGNLTRNRMCRSKLLKQKSVGIRPSNEWISHDYGDIIDNKPWLKIPPLITKEVWETAQRIRDSRAGDSRGKYKGKGKFSGIIHCKCGCNYIQNSYKDKQGKTHTYLVCFRKKQHGVKACNSINLSEEKILNIINQDYCNALILRQKLVQLQAIRRSITELKSKMDNYSKDDLEALNDRLYKVKQRKDVLLDRLLDNTINKPTYQDKAKELDTTISELQQQINEIESNFENTNNKIQELKNKEKVVAGMSISNNWTNDQIIKMIKSIDMDGNKMTVQLNINNVIFEDELYI